MGGEVNTVPRPVVDGYDDSSLFDPGPNYEAGRHNHLPTALEEHASRG